MSKNITMLDVTKVNENQLPTIISTQFDRLTELENNVQKAVNMAATAKEKAEEAKVSAGLFKKRLRSRRCKLRLRVQQTH